MNRVIRESISMCSSFQSPRSWGLMRPSGRTAVASVKTSAAPPTARLPKCTRCQSVAKPSVLEYWHIGETTMRLRSRTSRICRLSNSTGRLLEAKGFGFWGDARIARSPTDRKVWDVGTHEYTSERAISHRGDEPSHADDWPPVQAAAEYARRPSRRSDKPAQRPLRGRRQQAQAPDYRSRCRHCS